MNAVRPECRDEAKGIGSFALKHKRLPHTHAHTLADSPPAHGGGHTQGSGLCLLWIPAVRLLNLQPRLNKHLEQAGRQDSQGAGPRRSTRSAFQMFRVRNKRLKVVFLNPWAINKESQTELLQSD